MPTFTVHDVLRLPAFVSAQLVAGSSGLNRPVQGLHLSRSVSSAGRIRSPSQTDAPDHPHQILLTMTGHWPTAPEQIAQLAKDGCAAVVVQRDNGPATDANLRRRATQTHLPLIELPPSLPLPAVVDAILTEVAQRQAAELERSQEVHQQLTAIVLRGGTLADLAETLGQLIGRAVTIEDPALRVLAKAINGPIDDARRRSVVNGRTSPEVSERLLRAGIYDRIRHNLEPEWVAPMPDLGMTLPRIVVPIVVDREIHGYFWIISTEEQRPLDMLTATQGATIAALLIFKERAVAEAEAAQRGDFFDLLLNELTDTAEFKQRADRLRFRTHKPHQILIIHGPPQSGGAAQPLMRDVQEWLQRQALSPLTVWRNDQVIIVLEGRKGVKVAQKLWRELNHPARKLLIGISPVAENLVRIPERYEEAREAVAIDVALGQDEGVRPFDTLGLLHWLYHLPPKQVAGNQYVNRVQTLADYDHERDAELVKTVEAYLDHGASLVDAAQVLHIHRNTLVHRLRRIEEIGGIDMQDPLVRLNMHVAVKLFHLRPEG